MDSYKLLSIVFGVLFIYWGVQELSNINKPRILTDEEVMRSYKYTLIFFGLILIIMGFMLPASYKSSIRIQN